MTDRRLRYTPGHRGLVGRAQTFLHFKHKYEALWEFTEFVLIVAVFVLMFLKQGEYSHAVGLIAHGLAFLLLLGKLLSIAAWQVSVRHEDVYGVEK